MCTRMYNVKQQQTTAHNNNNNNQTKLPYKRTSVGLFTAATRENMCTERIYVYFSIFSLHGRDCHNCFSYAWHGKLSTYKHRTSKK